MPDDFGIWPTLNEDPTGVLERDTLAGAPGPPPGMPPPAGPPPGYGLGLGMLLGLLVAALVAAGVVLAWYVTNRRASPPVTTVVTSAPTAGAVAAAKVVVPKVAGLKEEQALVRLAAAGLQPKELHRQTPQPTGTVVSQQPSASTRVAKGTIVRIVVDGGAPMVAMPDVVGRAYGDARSQLDKLGLTATETEVTSTKPAGTVVDQAPKPGTRLAKGGNVTLSVAKAPPATTTNAAQATTTTAAPPPPESATVPDLGGDGEAAAAQALWQAGIFPSFVFVPATDPLGTVEQQARQSGNTVPYHAHMQVNLSRGPGQKPNERVPNVVGQALQQAVSTLNGAHLRLLYLREPVSSRTSLWKVEQQTPPAGAHAPRNAQVLVFVTVYTSGG